jgi:hypothetical protein
MIGGQMILLFGIVVLVLLVFSAGFRRFALIAVVIGAGVIGLLFMNSASESKASHSRIPAADLQFDNVRLSSEYGSYSISGRVVNKSTQYTLEDAELFITVQDCNSAPAHCTTIGEASAFLSVGVPPGQARDFNSYVSFSSPLHPRGQFPWYYTLKQTTAR